MITKHKYVKSADEGASINFGRSINSKWETWDQNVNMNQWSGKQLGNGEKL